MKFSDGFTGFGSNLVFNCESSEQPTLSERIENRLPVRRPCGCQFFNFRRHRYLGLGHQARSADFDTRAFHERLRSSTRKRLEIRGCQSGQASAPGFGDDCFGERMFGVGFDSGGARNQIVFGRARCRRDSRHGRRTACQGSGLVENDHVQIAGTFECESVLNQEPVLGP